MLLPGVKRRPEKIFYESLSFLFEKKRFIIIDMISLLLIADQEYGIGTSGRMPWYFPAYQDYFEAHTRGHVIIMGRNTYITQGPVPGSTNIVLSREHPSLVTEQGVLVMSDLHHAVEKARWIEVDSHTTRDHQDEIFIVGGAELFEHALVQGVAENIYLTHIPRRSYDCDVFFQDSYLYENFNEQYRTVRYADEANSERLEHIVYKRRCSNDPHDKKKTP